MKSPSHIVLAASLLLVMTPQLVGIAVQSRSAESAPVAVAPGTRGRLPVQVRWQSNFGCSIQFEKHGQGQPVGPALLVTIDGQALRDKSKNEIESMLLGPVGKEIELGLLVHEDTLTAYRIACAPYADQATGEAIEENSFKVALSRFLHRASGGEPKFSNFVRVLPDGGENQNLDLAVKSGDRDLLQYVRSWPGPSKENLTYAVAMTGVIDYLMIGDLAGIDRYVKLAHESIRPSTLNATSAERISLPAIRALAAAGRSADAKLLTVDALKVFDSAAADKDKKNNRREDGSRLQLLQLYAQLLAPTDKAQALAIADSIKPSVVPGYTTDLVCGRTLGDLYYKLGDIEKAISSCEIDWEQRKSWLTTRELQFSQVAELNAIAYRLAFLHHQAGREDRSREYIEQAIARDKKLPPACFESLNKMSGVFPAPADLDLALRGKFLTENLSDDQADELAANVSLLADAYKNIELNAPAKYKSDIDLLLKKYSEAVPLPTRWQRPRLSLFSSILGLARSLADHGKFEQSNDLLRRLSKVAIQKERLPLLELIVETELATNATRNGKTGSSVWETVVKMLAVSDDWPSENMRRLARYYSQGGDLARAEIIYDQACNAAKVSGNDLSPQMVLLLLDGAMLQLQKGNADKSDQNVARAFDLVVNVPPAKSEHDRRSFNRCYRTYLCDLALLNVEKNRAAVAEKMLRQALVKVQDPITTPPKRRHSADPDYSNTINAALGVVLFNEGKIAEARPYLDSTVTPGSDNVRTPIQLLRGKSALAEKDFKTAAEVFTVVSEHCDISDMHIVDATFSESFLRQAIAAAEKAEGFAPIALAKLYTTLADRCRSAEDKGVESLSLYKKAYAILPDSDPAKSSAASCIAGLQMSTGTAAGVTQGDTTANLEMYEKAAMLAEKNNTAGREGGPAQLWFNLASAEIHAGQVDKGIKHAEHAIDITKIPDSSLSYEFRSGSVGPAYALEQMKRLDDAERLMQRMQKLVEQVRGVDSLEAQLQREQFFAFYIRTGQREKAFTTLDQINSYDSRKLTFDRFYSGGFSDPVSVATAQLREKSPDLKLAKLILTKYLAGQSKYYAVDDIHLSKIYVALAQIDEAAGDLQSAEKNLRLAVAVDRKYGDISISNSRGLLNALLRKTGKDSEADALMAAGKKADRQRDEQFSRSSNTPAAMAEQYDWLARESPYNYRLGELVDQMLVKEKDPAQILRLALQGEDILDHGYAVRSGGCTPSTPPSNKRSNYYVKAINASRALGNEAQATALINKALAQKSYHPTFDEYLFLAEIEGLKGDRTAAGDFARKAEKLIVGTPMEQFYGQRLVELWRKIGDKEQRDRVAADVNSARDLDAQRRARERWQSDAARRRRAGSDISDAAASQTIFHTTPVPAGTYEGVQRTPEISFKYALLASNTLTIEDPAVIVPQGDYFRHTGAFCGSFGALRSANQYIQDDKFAYLFAGPKGLLIAKPKPVAPPSQPYGSVGGSTGFVAMGTTVSPLTAGMMMTPMLGPPPVQELPFKPAPAAPAGAKALGEVNGPLVLDPGDYTATRVTTGSIIVRKPGRVRLFLTDGPAATVGKQPVFLCSDVAFINVKPDWPMDDRMVQTKLEIWYSGTGVIRLDDQTKFRGLIYAPNARLEIGPGEVLFNGAAVAKDIRISGSTKVVYSPSFSDWKAE